MINISDLIKAGVHFGHQTWRWCPRMAPYIWGEKNGVHLIDVAIAARQIEKAAQFLEAKAADGASILWVGTKKPAQVKIRELTERLRCPYVVHRWIGGTFTNFSQVKKSVTKLLHYEDIVTQSQAHHYTKKELGVFQKMVERLNKNVGGIRTLTWPVGAVIVVDVRKEHTVVKEAQVAGIPIVALVDTNSDPRGIDYVIPSNDDIPRAINVILDYLAEAIERGQARSSKNRPNVETTAENIVEKMIEQVLGAEEPAKDPNRRPRGVRSRRGRSGATSQRPKQ